LFSLLHACALECLTDISHREFPILDVEGLDQEHLNFLIQLRGRLRVDVVSQWIIACMVDSMKSGVVAVPPPIFTRVYQQLERSKQEFSQVIQLMDIPFPFPYAQAAKILLLLYCVVVPYVMAFWSQTVMAAFGFTFTSTMSVFV